MSMQPAPPYAVRCPGSLSAAVWECRRASSKWSSRWQDGFGNPSDVPRSGNGGNCWQRWKLLATLEIAGNAGNCWQRWKLLATLERNWVTPCQHFQQFLHVRRSNGFWHLAAPLAPGRPIGQHLHMLGTTPFATMRGLDMLVRPQGGRWCSRRAKAWHAHLMARHFFRRRITFPDDELLQKWRAKSIWHATFLGGANPCSDKPWRGGLGQTRMPGNAPGGHRPWLASRARVVADVCAAS